MYKPHRQKDVIFKSINEKKNILDIREVNIWFGNQEKVTFPLRCGLVLGQVCRTFVHIRDTIRSEGRRLLFQVDSRNHKHVLPKKSATKPEVKIAYRICLPIPSLQLRNQSHFKRESGYNESWTQFPKRSSSLAARHKPSLPLMSSSARANLN